MHRDTHIVLTLILIAMVLAALQVCSMDPSSLPAGMEGRYVG